MIRSNDPVMDAARYEEEQEELLRSYMKGCPWCVVCDEQITDAKCYILDPGNEMEACVCKDCMDGIMNQMRRAKINTLVLEWFSEQLEYGDNGKGFERVTPHREVEYGF